MTETTATAAPTGNLEITVSRAELLRELTAAQSVVERKTTIPILSNFLFEASDDKLTITATDLDQSLRTSCAAKVKKAGRVHDSGAQAVRLHQAAARRRHLDQADGQPLGADPRGPVEYEDGGDGAGELSAGAGVSGERCGEDLGGIAAEHGFEDDLCDLE